MAATVVSGLSDLINSWGGKNKRWKVSDANRNLLYIDLKRTTTGYCIKLTESSTKVVHFSLMKSSTFESGDIVYAETTIQAILSAGVHVLKDHHIPTLVEAEVDDEVKVAE